MWVVIKEKFKSSGPLVMGGRRAGRLSTIIDRVVDSLEEVESGEIFFKCNVKK